MSKMTDSDLWKHADARTKTIALQLATTILQDSPGDATTGQVLVAQIMALLAYLGSARDKPQSCVLLELAAVYALDDLLFTYNEDISSKMCQ